jgi:Flp pilus assembly protein TadG
MTLWYQRGATVLEAALVLPVLFLLLMATFEFGAILSAYETMVSAVREGARYAVAPLSGSPISDTQ